MIFDSKGGIVLSPGSPSQDIQMSYYLSFHPSHSPLIHVV